MDLELVTNFPGENVIFSIGLFTVMHATVLTGKISQLLKISGPIKTRSHHNNQNLGLPYWRWERSRYKTLLCPSQARGLYLSLHDPHH